MKVHGHNIKALGHPYGLYKCNVCGVTAYVDGEGEWRVSSMWKNWHGTQYLISINCNEVIIQDIIE